ncbi:hypothetical protein FRC19_007766 [Serendipita sp. 401]|nr:hypothetical protein FRC19_007766 [Serendipita sp. 401]KAG9057258.1 hypothetical protein FS842_008065 [Serendipita sp. 407]
MSSDVPYTTEACCQIPVVQSTYQPQGEIIKMGKYDDVYVVGNKGSTTSVINVFDIFGFFPQTQQGADILAETLGARVYMPDFFFGKPYPLAEHPPKNDEQKKNFSAFFATTAAPDNVLPGLLEFANQLRKDGTSKLYVYGFCWGGKIATLCGCQTREDSSQPLFDAVAAVHPAMMNAADGKNLLVPIGIFPSQDENVEEFKKMVSELESKPFASKNAYRVYPTMHHGWAAARANLDDEENLKQYKDVYSRLATFFQNAA